MENVDLASQTATSAASGPSPDLAAVDAPATALAPGPAPEPKLTVIDGLAANHSESGPFAAAAEDDNDEDDDDELDELLESNSVEFLGFSVKYGATTLSLRLGEDDSVADLKAILYSLTDVPPQSQKLLGLTRGKPPSDDDLIGQIQYAPAALKPRPQNVSKPGETGAVKQQVFFMLLGTPEADRFQDQKILYGGLPPNPKQFDENAAPVPPEERPPHSIPPHEDKRNHARLEKVIARFSNFPVMSEPRPGKRLLVLDLDYTLADTKRLLDPTSPASLAARPGLHELLTSAYRHFDICVWSQTSWRWLEVKLIELGMIGHPDYKISFVIDRTPMFHVRTPGFKKHEVKPLELIWRRWPEFYGPRNTLHIDDLSRNFVMNPWNGLKIKAYKDSPKFDTELQGIQRFLRQLAHESITDFRRMDFHNWRHFRGPERED